MSLSSTNRRAAIVAVVLFVISILFPPFSENMGRGSFREFAFVLSSPWNLGIDWTILALEWVLIAVVASAFIFLWEKS